MASKEVIVRLTWGQRLFGLFHGYISVPKPKVKKRKPVVKK
jgi:hypothetical protein